MTEEIIPIYSGRPEDFTWVGFGSGSGTNLRECAKVIKPKLIFSDRPNAKLLYLDELKDTPKETINGYDACGSWKKAQGNPEAEKRYKEKSGEFNRQILYLLRKFEQQNDLTIDLIVLGGYMRFVEEPLLSAYKDRIINVHPADISILDSNGKRKFVGGDAVYDVIKAGEKTTKSSVIIVDQYEDHGEILTQGSPLEIRIELPREVSLRNFAKEQQKILKERSDWPALTTALKMISEGRIALGTEKKHHNEWRIVYIDGKPVGYEGFQVK
jgi:phosphoribosylglycinamide formyltransferase-1